MSLAVAELTSNRDDEKDRGMIAGNWVDQHLMRRPVEQVGASIIFRPALMNLGRFYMVEVGSKPYLYRRVSGVEVEVYGLAE